MSGAEHGHASTDRYLRLLGVSRRTPGREALGELVRAHLTRIPFENVSKLYRYRSEGYRGIPDLEEFLDGIERHHFGGTCYSNNYHLHGLLRDLGYDAILCGADMARPDVHIVNIVRMDEREFLVDAGYGGPFLDPMPLGLPHDHEVALGRERYVLRPKDASGRSRMELYRDGRLRHGYLVNPAPRSIGEFARVVDESFSDAATFMNALVLVRFSGGGSVVLHNLALVESEGTSFRTELVERVDDLPRVIEARFGIPRDVSRAALDGIHLSLDPWG